METSDSDVESECFESAEESLDENEEKKEKNKFKKNLRKSESESSAQSPCHLEKDNSNNPLSYRKRPEKSKFLSSKTPVKPFSKTSPKEKILKTDKIIPDVFFQDITSNLSKNINKSFSSIQQTSSNVKDLILSSLPATSNVISESFSYDDKNTSIPFDNESREIQFEENNPSEEPFKIINKKNVEVEKKTSDVETTVTEVDFSINEKLEFPNITNSLLQKDECNFESKITGEMLRNEVNVLDKTNNSINLNTECSVTNNSDSAAENSPSEETNVPNIKEKNVVDKNPNSENLKIFSQSQEIDIISENIDNSEPDNLKNLVGCSEEKIVDLENGQDNSNLKNKDVNISLIPDKNLVNSQSIFYELKTALENIMKEEINCEESNNESLSNDNAKELSSSEGKTGINETLNEGWDDFDFSDSEVENVELNKETNFLNKKSVEENKITENMNLKSVNEKSNLMDSALDQNNLKKSFVISKKTDYIVENKNFNMREKNQLKEKMNNDTEYKESAESKVELDDTWDWDNWDEAPSDKSQPEVPLTENPGIKNIKKKHFEMGKWSGWDTFAQKPQEKQGTWGFGSWGVDALLNKATSVTHGISSVLEAGLGAPDPETLARMEIENKKGRNQTDTETEECQLETSKKNSLTNVNIFPVSGITNLVAGVTSKIVEHSKIQEIGSKVITGGLDTLETFGKKTMEVLQEGDPGLKNKRALLLGNNKPVLSQVLREAREKANAEMKKAEEKEWARKCHFETLFDDFQGMVHLEALEMVSRQCELKLDQIKNEKNSEELEHLNELLEEIEQLCCLDECEMNLKSSVLDFKTALQMAVKPLKNEISIEKLIRIHEDASSWLQMPFEIKPSFAVIYQKLVSTLAELTAATVHQFHKGGELLSVTQCRRTLQEVDGLSSLTSVLCKEINHLCEKFFLLSRNGNSPESDNNTKSIKEKITEVQKNSMSYIKQAFDLLIPIIQLGAVAS